MKNADVQLIHRVLDGDDSAFTELVKKYQKSVHALAWRKVQDFHIAEDITQETFLKAYKGLSTLKEQQSFASWLYVIATNHCKTWLSKKRLQTQPLEDIDSEELEKSTYSSYVSAENERASVEAQREVVKKLLAKLQESDRTVITLYYLGGMTYEEISKFLGVSVSAIKNRLYRARQFLKKEEPMIREALENYQITPHLTQNIMQEISRLKPTPTASKPLVPWAIAASSAIIIMLMLGIGSQHLLRFQNPYSLDTQAEMTVELVDAPIVLNLNAKTDEQNQIEIPTSPGKNNGAGQKTDETDSLDLGTIIAKMKQSDNAVTSVTGNFIIERHRNYEISGNPLENLSIERNTKPKIEKIEYKLTWDAEKVKVDCVQGFHFQPITFWDGKQHWEVSLPEPVNLLLNVKINLNKEITVQEKIKQAFKQADIELTDDVHIHKGELLNSYKVTKKDKTYFVLLAGETTMEVYKHNVGYAVRPHWFIRPHDADPRWWLTFPNNGSDNTYLSQSLWQLLEKHESEIIGNDVLEIIGSDVLDGEKTTVIRLTKPARIIGDHTIRPKHFKLWISHDKGFRLVKSEEEYIEEDTSEWSPTIAGVTYINTRKIEYHEYLPNVWFPKRIEISTVPKAPSEHRNGEPLLIKDIIITKNCQLNADVSKLLRLDIFPETPVFDYGVRKALTVGELETQPNFQMQPIDSDVPSKSNRSE